MQKLALRLTFTACALATLFTIAPIATGDDAQTELKRLKKRAQKLERKIQQLEANLGRQSQASVAARQHESIPLKVYASALQRSYESYFQKKVEERLSIIPGVRVSAYVEISAEKVHQLPPLLDKVKVSVSVPSSYFRRVAELAGTGQDTLKVRGIRSIERIVLDVLPEPPPYPVVVVDQHDDSIETARGTEIPGPIKPSGDKKQSR